MSNASLLISADAHVAENQNLRARLPEHLRGRMPLLVPGTGGDLDDEIHGEVRNRSSWKTLSARDRELEFRTDTSLGTDLDRRKRDMAREGVYAQVIFRGGLVVWAYSFALAWLACFMRSSSSQLR